MTLYTKVVLATLALHDEQYGYELCSETGIAPSTVYPVLDRLEKAGLVKSTRRRNPDNENLPRRRYYRLTASGKKMAAAVELPAFAMAGI